MGGIVIFACIFPSRMFSENRIAYCEGYSLEFVCHFECRHSQKSNRCWLFVKKSLSPTGGFKEQ